MAEIKKGAPVLFFGRTIHVTSLEDRDGKQLAVCEDLDGLEKREAARNRFREVDGKRRQLRQEGKAEAVEEATKELERINEEATAALFRLRIRTELLDYWEEKEVWVSDGRILSDDQRESFRALFGRKPKPEGERQALLLLEKGGN